MLTNMVYNRHLRADCSACTAGATTVPGRRIGSVCKWCKLWPDGNTLFRIVSVNAFHTTAAAQAAKPRLGLGRELLQGKSSA